MKYSLAIPGVGDVEVADEHSLRQLKKQLDGHYSKLRAQTEKEAQLPSEILKALQGIAHSNELLINTVIVELKKIKPSVIVEAPVVNVPEPKVNVTVPAPQVTVQPAKVEIKQDKAPATKPAVKLRIGKVVRNWKGQLDTGTEIEVIR